MNKKDYILIILIILAGIFTLPGCAKRPEHPHYEYVTSGKCWVWDKIEKEREGKERCFKPWQGDPGLRCQREKGHKGRHHIHIFDDCLAVFGSLK